MEKFNPFENRYPNRRQVMDYKNKKSEELIKNHNKLYRDLNLKKDIESLNAKNTKLTLFSSENMPFKDENFPKEFNDYGQIPDIIKNNLKKININSLTPIQRLSFAYLFNYNNYFFNENNNYDNNYDLVGCAQTGSGKTISYLIPSVSFLFNDIEGINQITNRKNYKSYPLILIILPTRELAIQTYEETMKILYKSYINTVIVYGGENHLTQLKELETGCDILIGTPGRLIDFLEKGVILLNEVKFVIIDEADKLLDMGFEEDIQHIIFDFDLGKNYNTFMFSATFPKKVLNMVNYLLREGYSYITPGNYLGDLSEVNGNVKQRFYLLNCERRKEFELKKKNLYGLLNIIKGKTLIFINKKSDVEILYNDLYSNNYGVVYIHGEMNMEERKYVMEMFKNGKVKLMIASDLASRGLDIPAVDYVINFDMPTNIDVYIHRIGRTGRAGNKGSSLTLLTEEDRRLFRDIIVLLQKTNEKIPDFLFH